MFLLMATFLAEQLFIDELGDLLNLTEKKEV